MKLHHCFLIQRSSFELISTVEIFNKTIRNESGRYRRMIRAIYEFWEVIAVASVICGIIFAFIGKKRSKVGIVGLMIMTALFVTSGISYLTCTMVPNVIGQSLQNAVQTLNDADLDFTIVKNKPFVADAEVTQQKLSAGEVVLKHTELVIDYKEVNTDSVPIGMVKVPNVVGLTESQAIELLKSKGLDGSSYWNEGALTEYDENKTYYVREQQYDKDSYVKEGTIVGLGIFEPTDSAEIKDKKIIVPNVVGMEQHEATSLLTRKGLEFQVWWTDEDILDDDDIYYVKEQSIKAGEEVALNTLIKLHISSEG